MRFVRSKARRRDAAEGITADDTPYFPDAPRHQISLAAPIPTRTTTTRMTVQSPIPADRRDNRGTDGAPRCYGANAPLLF